MEREDKTTQLMNNIFKSFLGKVTSPKNIEIIARHWCVAKRRKILWLRRLRGGLSEFLDFFDIGRWKSESQMRSFVRTGRLLSTFEFGYICKLLKQVW